MSATNAKKINTEKKGSYNIHILRKNYSGQ